MMIFLLYFDRFCSYLLILAPLWSSGKIVSSYFNVYCKNNRLLKKKSKTTGLLQVIVGQKATCSNASNNEEILSANIHAYSLLPLTVLYFSRKESRVTVKI